MLAAYITIKNIEYEKTLEGVFPMLKEKIDRKESERMTIRLFQKLDDDALPIALNIMSRLPKAAKTELMMQILNTYSDLIRDKLNEKLSEHHIGKNLHVGEVSIAEQDDVLYLWIGHVKVDYKNLVKEKVPGKLGILGGLAGAFAGERLEQTALNLLWNDENRKNLIALARDILNRYGIVMELDDIALMKDAPEAAIDAIEAGNCLQLTDEIEEQILDALAGYLKDTVKRNEVSVRK